MYLRFEGSGDRPEFPPPVSEPAAVAEIVDKLSAFRPEIKPTWLEGGILPEKAPPISIGSTTFGCTFHAAPFGNALPDTTFFTATGFEVGFGMLTIHRPADAWEQLVNIIRRKDKAGSDDLIITVGGPDHDGYSYPSEQVLADLALEFSGVPPETHYLSTVRLHYWSTGRIVQVVPERLEVVEPLYRGGLVPAHLHLGSVPDSEA